MSQREEEPDCRGALVLLHQFASDVIDGRNMICIDRVTQAKGVGQQGRSEQGRKLNGKSCKGQDPRNDVKGDQKDVDANNPPSKIPGTVIEDTGESRETKVTAHGTSSIQRQTIILPLATCNVATNNIA